MNEGLYEKLEKKSGVCFDKTEKQNFRAFCKANISLIESITQIDTTDINLYSHPTVDCELLREDTSEG